MNSSYLLICPTVTENMQVIYHKISHAFAIVTFLTNVRDSLRRVIKVVTRIIRVVNVTSRYSGSMSVLNSIIPLNSQTCSIAFHQKTILSTICSGSDWAPCGCPSICISHEREMILDLMCELAAAYLSCCMAGESSVWPAFLRRGSMGRVSLAGNVQCDSSKGHARDLVQGSAEQVVSSLVHNYLGHLSCTFSTFSSRQWILSTSPCHLKSFNLCQNICKSICRFALHPPQGPSLSTQMTKIEFIAGIRLSVVENSIRIFSLF